MISNDFLRHLNSTHQAKLLACLSKNYALCGGCLESLKEHLLPQTLQAQELLLEAGQTNDRFYWIETGLIRFFSDADGEDITTGFYREGDFFCAVSSFFAHKPATESICAEETTHLLSIRYADLQRLFGQYPELNDAFHRLYGCFLAQRQADAAFLRYDTSIARYEAFLALYPHLAHRVLVKHIASFLHLHRVTLCNIRRDLAKKTKIAT